MSVGQNTTKSHSLGNLFLIIRTRLNLFLQELDHCIDPAYGQSEFELSKSSGTLGPFGVQVLVPLFLCSMIFLVRFMELAKFV